MLLQNYTIYTLNSIEIKVSFEQRNPNKINETIQIEYRMFVFVQNCMQNLFKQFYSTTKLTLMNNFEHFYLGSSVQ